MFAVFGPFVAFMILVKTGKSSYKETFKRLFKKAPFWTIVFALFSSMAVSAAAYGFYLLYATGSSEPINFKLTTIVPLMLTILVVGGPVEEFGWRGFLLPELKSRQNTLITILVLGIIHGIWHLPLHFLEGTVQQAIPIHEFLIITICITVSYVFIHEYTTSLIPMIALHWFANLSSAIFPYYYNVQGRYALFFITLLLDLFLMYILYRKHKSAKRIAE